ncbi:hypothetical protein C7T35_16795 [Variovorax sp. WS11]|uniref:restriction endonuclease subunit S n=1 Tax=Variovorax sp. WS11 TaxID=1105204 RepID=UPI000D0D8940|nr:restriction endonuclease subunit S [Variovorax sp. WS11]NDZ15551.1 restriction endonuclease subunit S [Variovorax sp. WS11]PSL83317.1 hypothetical protein C7T35_16795 [Variovorax sp. WS11]
MSDLWPVEPLGKHTKVKARIGWRGLASSEYTDDGPLLVAGKHVRDGQVDWTSCDHITEYRYRESMEIALEPGDVILTKDGTIGRVARIDCLPGKATLNGTMMLLRPGEQLDYRYLFHVLRGSQFKRLIDDKVSGSSIPHIFQRDMVLLPISLPPRGQQVAIADVLDALDITIRQTEAIIQKFEQVKQGLLHDLLTRGIDANGELRPRPKEAPHLYKESVLGWIPRKWEARAVDQVSESIVDGPFGSNLKTEHYVDLPGVRVVRLQNIGIGNYDDNERAFVSEQKAASLNRNEVSGGDVLVAALGDARYPVGRACCYPDDLPPAVNKADCFRLRPRNDLAIGAFVMRSLNGAVARRQIRGFEQGVTMQRVNIGNLKRIVLALPPVEEQESACAKLASLDRTLATNVAYLLKSREQKAGLMDDLLTGRVCVAPLLD